MKLFALIAVLFSSQAMATQLVNVTVSPVVDGNFCKYETSISFVKFPDYEVFSKFGDNNTWIKAERNVLTTVEIKSTDNYVLHLQPEPQLIEDKNSCKDIPLLVIVR